MVKSPNRLGRILVILFFTFIGVIATVAASTYLPMSVCATDAQCTSNVCEIWGDALIGRCAPSPIFDIRQPGVSPQGWNAFLSVPEDSGFWVSGGVIQANKSTDTNTGKNYAIVSDLDVDYGYKEIVTVSGNDVYVYKVKLGELELQDTIALTGNVDYSGAAGELYDPDDYKREMVVQSGTLVNLLQFTYDGDGDTVVSNIESTNVGSNLAQGITCVETSIESGYDYTDIVWQQPSVALSNVSVGVWCVGVLQNGSMWRYAPNYPDSIMSAKMSYTTINASDTFHEAGRDYRKPIITDLDSDGALEVYIINAGGDMYAMNPYTMQRITTFSGGTSPGPGIYKSLYDIEYAAALEDPDTGTPVICLAQTPGPATKVHTRCINSTGHDFVDEISSLSYTAAPRGNIVLDVNNDNVQDYCSFYQDTGGGGGNDMFCWDGTAQRTTAASAASGLTYSYEVAGGRLLNNSYDVTIHAGALTYRQTTNTSGTYGFTAYTTYNYDEGDEESLIQFVDVVGDNRNEVLLIDTNNLVYYWQTTYEQVIDTGALPIQPYFRSDFSYYSGVYGWYPIACEGVAMNFTARECDGTIPGVDSCNYFSEPGATERLAVMCDYPTGAPVYGAWDANNPQVSCTWNTAGTYDVVIYLQNDEYPGYLTEYADGPISVTVIDGIPGTSCFVTDTQVTAPDLYNTTVDPVTGVGSGVSSPGPGGSTEVSDIDEVLNATLLGGASTLAKMMIGIILTVGLTIVTVGRMQTANPMLSVLVFFAWWILFTVLGLLPAWWFLVIVIIGVLVFVFKSFIIGSGAGA